MTSIIHDFKSLNQAARLQDGGDDHYAPESRAIELPVTGSINRVVDCYANQRHAANQYAGLMQQGLDVGSGWYSNQFAKMNQQIADHSPGPVVTVYQPVDGETYAAAEAARIRDMAANFTQPINTRLMSIMTNASILRGSPESKASNLMRLLQEQGLRIVELNEPSET